MQKGAFMTRDSDTVHIVVGWNDDYENAYTHAAALGEADETEGVYEADVPAALWSNLEAARKAWDALHAEVVVAAGFDASEGRMAKCCGTWAGHQSPARVHWNVVLATDGTEQTWPTRDHMLTTFETEGEASAFIAAMPDEFYANTIGHFVPVARSRFRVERGGWGGSVPACYRCGWPKADHDA